MLIFGSSGLGYSITDDSHSPGAEADIFEIEDLLNHEQWNIAERKIVEWLRSRPGEAGNEVMFYNLGICHYNMGRYEDALDDFEIALLKMKGSPEILENKAKTLLMMGRTEEAMQTLAEAIENDKENSTLYKMRGFMHFNNGELKKAKDDFEQYERLRGGSLQDERPETLVVMARVEVAQGSKERAKELYNLVTERTEDADLAMEGLFYFMANEDDEQTKTLVNKLVRRFPEDGRLYLVSAVLCERAYLHTEADMNKKIANQYGIDSQIIEFFIKENLNRK